MGYDFLDLSKLTVSPKTSPIVVDMYIDLLEGLKKDGFEFNKLAFIERTLGPLMISSELSQRMNLESIVVRTRNLCSCPMCTDPKLRIKCATTSPLLGKDNIVVISDVLTTGGTILEAVELIKKSGARIVAVITILDRQVPKDKALRIEQIKQEGIELRSFIKRNELLSLGFARPLKQDLETLDYFALLKDALIVKEEDKPYFDSLVADILENKKDMEFDEESQKFVRNILISILNITRVKVLQATAEDCT